MKPLPPSQLEGIWSHSSLLWGVLRPSQLHIRVFTAGGGDTASCLTPTQEAESECAPPRPQARQVSENSPRAAAGSSGGPGVLALPPGRPAGGGSPVLLHDCAALVLQFSKAAPSICPPSNRTRRLRAVRVCFPSGYCEVLLSQFISSLCGFVFFFFFFF